jgi:hypothetical protein
MKQCNSASEELLRICDLSVLDGVKYGLFTEDMIMAKGPRQWVCRPGPASTAFRALAGSGLRLIRGLADSRPKAASE